MGDRNSLETYVSIVMQLHQEIAQCYPESREHRLDRMKIRSRLNNEGFSFLTKTLPRLGKAIDTALSGLRPLEFQGFSTRKNSALPNLLGWLLDRLFTADGYVRSDLDITALKHTRQFLYIVYKLNIPYETKTEKSVLDSFVATEHEIKNLTIPDDMEPILKQATTLVARLFNGFDPRDIVPRHGPGAVATGEECGEKSNFSRIYPALERIYPFGEYFTLGLSHVVDQLDWIQSLEVSEQPTAKVVLVPKDSRGPRLISCEPLEIQWIQQGLRESIYNRVEKHPLTRGHVNFRDQGINRELALTGSRTRKYVTLDMKDASDRVSLQLVERLFGGTTLCEALLASRSVATRLPDGSVVHLSKFAPMGSAVCFPIEALCFWALAVSVLHRSGRSLRYALRNVWVYGDDIITTDKDYHLLLRTFPKVGLKFNLGKCCVAGFFRESCGCDAYKGVDVTPVRMRTTWSHRKRSAEELTSYTAFSNALYERGYWVTAGLVRDLVESRYGPLLEIPDGCKSVLGFVRDHVNHHASAKARGIPTRFNRETHVLEYKTWTVRPKYKTYTVDGWRETLRSITARKHSLTYLSHDRVESIIGQPIEVDQSGSNFSRYALPRRSCLKRGWRPINSLSVTLLPWL
jgi:hypothetical protein